MLHWYLFLGFSTKIRLRERYVAEIQGEPRKRTIEREIRSVSISLKIRIHIKAYFLPTSTILPELLPVSFSLCFLVYTLIRSSFYNFVGLFFIWLFGLYFWLRCLSYYYYYYYYFLVLFCFGYLVKLMCGYLFMVSS